MRSARTGAPRRTAALAAAAALLCSAWAAPTAAQTPASAPADAPTAAEATAPAEAFAPAPVPGVTPAPVPGVTPEAGPGTSPETAPETPPGAASAAPPAGSPAASARRPARGPVTGLPLPRFVSLKASKANIRRGPGLDRRVDWVFIRRGMPLQVIAEHGHWRRVRDMDAAVGWVHYSLIRGDRTAVILPAIADIRRAPAPDAPLTARAERGVIVALEACGPEWCEISKGRAEGWILKTDLWGAAPGETFD
ncbi:MAG: SH3 domain-containing protein [Pseudomonadota bacterium]